MIRTVYQLSNKLDRALAWRKKELSTHKLMLQGPRSQAHEVALRAGVLLLYAHWEGFVKEAARLYVELVASSPRELRELQPGFLAIALRPEILECCKGRDPSKHLRLINAFRMLDGPPPITRSIQYRGVINAKSNLKFDVFRSILSTLAIKDAPYLTRAGQVRRLVTLRNGIAHGRGIVADQAEYESMQTDVVGLLDQFRDDLEDSATSRSFLL